MVISRRAKICGSASVDVSGLAIAQTQSQMLYQIHRESRPTRCGIILAAGEGNRLRSFVERLRGCALPNQYVNFVGKRSMLEHTVARADKLISSERLFTVVSQRHLEYPQVLKQLSRQPMGHIVAQPENRDTGPGLLLPLAHLYRRYPEATVAVFPSDHFILAENRFMAHVDQAFRVVERDPASIVLLGIRPSGAEPEYGYIMPGRKLDIPVAPDAREVSRFIEKPEREIARALVLGGGLWNTLVLVFKAKIFLDAVSRIAPCLHGSFEQIRRAVDTPSAKEVAEKVYQQMAPLNLSKGLLELLPREQALKLCALPVQGVHWSDWGSEARIIEVLRNSGSGYHLNEIPVARSL
jgi:mannose-1-phosphate guanylyltransferase